MNREIKLLDVVALLEDIPELGLYQGGAIWLNKTGDRTSWRSYKTQLCRGE